MIKIIIWIKFIWLTTAIPCTKCGTSCHHISFLVLFCQSDADTSFWHDGWNHLPHTQIIVVILGYLCFLWLFKHSRLSVILLHDINLCHRLYRCSLTEKSCSAIASAASSTCCSLNELNLSENEICDAGVHHLTDLLKNPQCKLEKLV